MGSSAINAYARTETGSSEEDLVSRILFGKLVDESPDRMVTLAMVQGGNADLAETAEMVGMTEAETTQLTEALIMATVQSNDGSIDEQSFEQLFSEQFPSL